MSTVQNIQRQARARLAAGWQTTRKCYRIANAWSFHALGALFKLALVLYFLFCVLVLGLRYLVLPNIDAYKTDMERLASAALGNRVTVEAIDASWSGLRPRLGFDRLVIHDKHGNAALTLPRVSATLSWWSLGAGDLRLQRLEILQPDLDVRRDADGRLYVAGIHLEQGGRGDSRGADWVLSQEEIVIRDGRLRWNDELRGAPELALENVDLVLRNAWRRHRFALRATPPQQHAAPLDVRADFVHPHFAGSISDPTRWTGQLYADVRDTDLAVWRSYLDYPVEIRQGTGSVRAWLDFDHARVANLTADLKLKNVAARLGADLEPLALRAVSGRVSVQEELNRAVQDGRPTFGQNGHAIALTDFSLQTEDGLFLPQTTISERYIAARNGRPARTEVQAELLDLQTLASFAERLPLPAEQRRLLAELAPRGVLKAFSAQWLGSYPHLSGYSIKGQFAGLSMRPRGGQPAAAKNSAAARMALPPIPGFDNLSGRVDASERGGSLTIASSDMSLQLPGWLEQPLMPFERLLMQANWSFQDKDQLLLELQKLEFVQDGISASVSGKHQMPLSRQPGQSPGTADFVARIDRFPLQKVGRYLPRQTPDGLKHWLSGALAGGVVKDVKLRLKGDLAHFPFHASSAGERARGEFTASAKIDDGVLNYAPGQHAADRAAPMWPLIDRIDGSILFDRARMEIRADRARSAGTELSGVKAVIPELRAHDMVLDVDGEAAGPLQNLVRFTLDSPVAEWIGHFTDETRASGNARLALKLQLPLDRLPEARVNGALHFAGNTVSLQNLLPPLAGASGRLDFNEKGFSLQGIRAVLLGGPVSLSGGTQRDGTILVKAEGSLTAEGILKAYGSTPALQRSTERISGGTRYATSIRVRNKQTEVSVESSLAGMGLDFPAPLRKAANESMPLRFDMSALPSDDPAVSRDELRIALGSTIAARYERRKDGGKDAAWRVVRGGIGVNQPAPQPDSGVVANVSVARLDIDAWRRVASSMAQGGAQREARQAPEADALGISQYIEPEVLAARADELIIMERKLDRVVVGASHQNGVWQANIDSEQASGYITWVESGYSGGMGRLTARLASLIIPKSAASEVTELLDGKDSATQMPAIDIVAENFELFGKKFGQLELAARNARGQAGREWRINRLSIVNPDGEFKASGRWVRQNGENLSSLNYTLDIADAGRLLDRFGFANLLRGGKGRMFGDISWKGMPFAFDIPSLNGNIQLDLASGQFLKADANAAKLLGVLSLQSLPRRLVLDFRDVFSEGFAFDGVAATATINQGVARTDNFKMRGVAATVLIDGSADIGQEAQNLHVAVIPDFNIGAASVVYGLAVNPVVGVGTFLAQLFLREPLMRAFTFEYQITGPWKDPVVTKLARKQFAPPAGDTQGNAEPRG